MRKSFTFSKVIPGFAVILLLAAFSQNVSAQNITGQPRDVTISAGHSSSVFFSVETNPGVVLKYQWFRKAPGALTADPIMGADGPVLELPFTALKPADTKINGYMYFCEVDDGVLKPERSNFAYIWVQEVKESVIIKHPEDVTQDIGFSGEIIFNIEVETGLEGKFVWFKRAPGPVETEWREVGSGQQLVEAIKELDPRQNGTAYRCLVQHAGGEEYSQVAYLWAKEPKILILTEPVDVTREEGFVGTISFDITPNPEYPETAFQWEIKFPGDVWTPIGGAEKPVLEYPIKDPLSSKLDGTAFRCIAKVKDITEVSEAAYLKMKEPNKFILAGPEDVMKKEGPGAELFFAIKFDDSYPLAFQWQEKKPGGSWVDIVDFVSYKPELYYKVEKLTLDLNGWGFRCVAINKDTKEVEYSREANLYVTPDIPYILGISGNVTVCEGASTDVKFAVKVEETIELSLQWQISPAGEKVWYDIKGATGEMLVKSYKEVPLSHNGNAFRCRATDTYGGVEFSDIVFLNVRALPEITTHPASQEKMVGEAVTFNVAATGYKPFNYQWLKGGTAITGATSSSLSLFPLAETDAADYSVIVSNNCANSNDTSNEASLVVNAPLFEDGWFAQTAIGNDFTDIKFAGANTGWITQTGSKFVYKTVDGGDNWNTVDVTDSKQWQAVFTTDADKVWIAGEAVIKYSTNGSNATPAWTDAAIDDAGLASGVSLFDLFFHSSSAGWAVGDNGLVLSTSDGGANWSPQHSGDLGGFITTKNLAAVHFVDVDTGFAVGAQGTIIVTRDGGTSWTTQTSGTSSGLKDVFFVDDQVGWASGESGVLLFTDNGGRDWSSVGVPVSVSDQSINGVHFYDTDHGWLVTGNGKILRTNDGGVNWYFQESGSSQALNAVDFADYDNGWVVGNSSTILRTAYSGCLTPRVSLFDDKEFCASVNYELVADSFSNNVDCSYLWSHGGGSTGTYTVTESGKYWVRVTSVCGVEVSDTVNIVLYPLPEPNAGSDQQICTGDSVQLLGTGGVEYSWNNAGYLDNPAIQNPLAGPPLGETEFILTVTDENLCENTDTVAITVYGIPSSAFTSPDEICDMDSATVAYTGTATAEGNFYWNFDERSAIASGVGSGPYLVTWDTTGSFRIELVVEENGCASDTSNAMITVHPIPTADFSIPDATCGADQVTVQYTGTVSVDAEFNWSFDGGSVISGDPAGPGPLALTWATGGAKTVGLGVTDHGCESGLTENQVTVSYPYSDQIICLATVDIETGKNAIIWEKPAEIPGVAFFNVYREGNVAEQYDLLATLPVDTLSYFVDETSEPESKSHKYKIAIIDTCGNESELSLYHKTMLLTTGLGTDRINVSWTEYQVENTGFGFVSYIIYRGPAADKLVPIDTIPADNTLYPDIDPPAGDVFYQVAGVIANECSPSGNFKAGTGPYSHSLSNLDDNKLKEESDTTGGDTTTAVLNIFDPLDDVKVYPNPFKEQVTVEFRIKDAGDVRIEVYNILGARIREIELPSQSPGVHSYDIMASELDGSSIYYLRFSIGSKTTVKKLIPAR